MSGMVLLPMEGVPESEQQGEGDDGDLDDGEGGDGAGESLGPGLKHAGADQFGSGFGEKHDGVVVAEDGDEHQDQGAAQRGTQQGQRDAAGGGPPAGPAGGGGFSGFGVDPG